MPSSTLIKQIAEEIESQSLFGRDAVLVLGVSGGPDSMALLHALCQLNEQPDWQLKLHIAHLNHGLRGQESDDDAAFVQQAADELNLPCTVEQRDIASLAGSGPGSIEEIARRERYAFLEQVCLKPDAKIVAVGHQRDDAAETVLHRVTRGTGLRGLVGIHPQRPIRPGSAIKLVRPLLSCDRSTLLAFLDENYITYREDSTNRSDSTMRNRIRHHVLPLLEEQVNPQVRQALLRLAEQARWLEEYLSQTVDRTFATLIISRTDQELELNAASLARKPRLLQTELIRRVAASFQLGEQHLGFAQIVSVLELLADPASGKQVHLPGGMTVTKRYNRLIFSVPTDEPRETIAAQIAVHVPGRTALTVRRLELICQMEPAEAQQLTHCRQRQHIVQDAAESRSRSGEVFEEAVDFDAVHPPLVVRSRMPGDRFWPLGAPGSKKLAQFLIDAKVDPDQREQVMVLCDQFGPIWVIGYRIDERVKLTCNTQTILRLTARPLDLARD